jgi:hypothetical protein
MLKVVPDIVGLLVAFAEPKHALGKSSCTQDHANVIGCLPSWSSGSNELAASKMTTPELLTPSAFPVITARKGDAFTVKATRVVAATEDPLKLAATCRITVSPSAPGKGPGSIRSLLVAAGPLTASSQACLALLALYTDHV